MLLGTRTSRASCPCKGGSALSRHAVIPLPVSGRLRPLPQLFKQFPPPPRHVCSLAARAEAVPPVKKTRGRKSLAATKPPLPSPAANQQTLQKSFTVGGLGLHSGDYAYVRVRPALAGEGRYFVRVPSGTNGHLFALDQPEQVPLEDFNQDGEEASNEGEDLKVQLFLQYLKAQEDEGYEGPFADWVGEELAEQLGLDDGEEEPELEEILARSDDEIYILASLDNVKSSQQHFTTLEQDGVTVQSVEHLLSALENCGVDNARIEIEGGPEVPIIDGSALGWVVNVQTAGLRGASSGEKDKVRKLQMEPKALLTVRGQDGSFVSFFPDQQTRLTYGIDHLAEAPIIGKQWLSWSPDDDEHYRWAIAPARTYAPSLEALTEMLAQGLVKGGSEGCSIVAYGDRWYDSEALRFFDDEPVRHKLLDLMGDLSLLAQGGNRGLPQGHIVAYQATHDLHLRFAKALRDSVSDADFTPVRSL